MYCIRIKLPKNLLKYWIKYNVSTQKVCKTEMSAGKSEIQNEQMK